MRGNALRTSVSMPHENCARKIVSAQLAIACPFVQINWSGVSTERLWAVADSIDTDPSFLSFLKLHRTAIAERRMSSSRLDDQPATRGQQIVRRIPGKSAQVAGGGQSCGRFNSTDAPSESGG